MEDSDLSRQNGSVPITREEPEREHTGEQEQEEQTEEKQESEQGREEAQEEASQPGQASQEVRIVLFEFKLHCEVSYSDLVRRRYSSTSSESSGSDSDAGHRNKRQKKQSEVERLAEIERLR